jgi:amidase
MTDLTFAPVHQLAQMIRDRQVSSLEVVEAYLSKISQHNSQLNAICTLDAENARSRATAADLALDKGENWGRLHGVPITVKDIFETAGLRTTAGYTPLKNYIPPQDATIVAKLKAAGAIVLGKSNMAELAGDYQSTNSLFPPVNNPWNLAYTPGGSSGGSAAAVAAGLSPLDLGNDFGGSIRQPAHFCGVYGLKPTDRRISTAGVIPETPGMPICLRQVMTVGCLARSITDLQLCFEIIAGADSRRPDVPPMPLDIPTGKSLPDLKIAWSNEWAEVPIAAEIKAAMMASAQKLVQAGAQITDWRPPNFNLSEIFELHGLMAAYLNRYAQPIDLYNLRRSAKLLWRTATQGDKKLRHLGNYTRFLPKMLKPSLQGYFQALTDLDRFITQMDAALEPWDVWICPVAVTTAFTHRPAWSPINIDGRAYPHATANGIYLLPFNLSGHPAVVIPIGPTQAGLPIGIQIVGKRWREMELLSIAQEIDKVIGSFRRPTGY